MGKIILFFYDLYVNIIKICYIQYLKSKGIITKYFALIKYYFQVTGL